MILPREIMEALRSLEDKWRLTTQAAILLFVFTAFTVIGLCSTTMLKKKKKKTGAAKLLEEELGVGNAVTASCPVADSSQGPAKKLLMDYMRWSERSKWDGLESGSWRWTPPLLLGSGGSEVELGWTHHDSASPVWQRPILMGEKCELPRFSGLILYDERGQLLPDKSTGGTTLMDLLV